MAIAYLSQQGMEVHVRRGVLRMTCDGKAVGDLPLHQLTGVVAYGRIEFSTAALLAACHAGVRVVLATRWGVLRAMAISPVDAAAPCRIGQHMCLADPAHRLRLARSVVRAKLAACLSLLSRYHANRPELGVAPRLPAIRALAERVPTTESVAALLGIEGTAAREYWAAFRALNCSPLAFEGRRSRPPGDALNALLSFGYSVLAGELISLLYAAGLDPCVGFYHTPHRGRPSLALDAMEPLRHAIVDRLILTAVNTGRFNPADFAAGPRGGVWLAPAARRTFLEIYETTMLSPAPKDMVTPMTAAGDLRGHLIRRVEELAGYFRKQCPADNACTENRKAA
jgi:CRISPR-associated protein Cas1